VSVFLLLLGAAIAALLTRSFCSPRSPLFILDHPNPRSLHMTPVPRSGGIAILAGWLTSVLAGFTLLYAVGAGASWWVAAVLLVAVVSFADDRFGVAARYRFLVHLGAAGMLVVGGLSVRTLVLPGMNIALAALPDILLTLIFVVWMVNLYNFMDGMDGFAAGMAIFGFTTFGVLGLLSDHPSYAFVNLAVAAAVAGFLPFNFPPARIFMGDTGASTLGLLAAASMLWAGRHGVFPLWLGLLVFSPFVVDASVTLLRRALQGERLWEAHRSHYYQRLVQLGWGHRRTVSWEYALMGAASLSALLAFTSRTAIQWLVLAVWMALYSGLAISVQRLAGKPIPPGS
jgi:UDP-N-acetylmuramyl pentapeptide phosphotransferase/UDP-N-acetylglucosamine-1-phosphate transferase